MFPSCHQDAQYSCINIVNQFINLEMFKDTNILHFFVCLLSYPILNNHVNQIYFSTTPIWSNNATYLSIHSYNSTPPHLPVYCNDLFVYHLLLSVWPLIHIVSSLLFHIVWCVGALSKGSLSCFNMMNKIIDNSHSWQ